MVCQVSESWFDVEGAIVDEQQQGGSLPENSPEVSESGPVRVRVARSVPDWTGHRHVEEIEAADVVAAQQWDERVWQR